MGLPLRKEIHVIPSSSPPTGLVYGKNEQPRSTHDWVLYSFQWLVTMVYAVVWGYAIVGVGLNFQGARMTTYISSVVLTIGVSTLLQAWLGHRMAMVHGPNVIPSLAIVAAFAAGGETYALQSFTAQALSGIIIVAVVALGAVRFIRKVWSPLVLGSMIIMIGLTVAQVGLGDMTQAGFGLGFLIALALAFFFGSSLALDFGLALAFEVLALAVLTCEVLTLAFEVLALEVSAFEVLALGICASLVPPSLPQAHDQ